MFPAWSPNQLGHNCEECGYVYCNTEDIYLHDYKHFGIKGLFKFALQHKSHILKDWNICHKIRGSLMNPHCHSFNVPLEPNQQINPSFISAELLKIRKFLGHAFKVGVGVSRILVSRVPSPMPELEFYRYVLVCLIMYVLHACVILITILI
jgi:hypothetical protein